MKLKSGWLKGMNPEWQVLPGNALFSERTEKSSPLDIHLTPSQIHGVLPQAEYMEITGNRVVLNLVGADNMKHVESDDFIIHLRSFQGGIEYSRYAGKVSNAYCVLIPKPVIYPGFYRWVLKSQGFIQELRSTTDQLRDGQSIKFEQFRGIGFPLPPIEEQRRIADYLDDVSSKLLTSAEAIDQIIASLNNLYRGIAFDALVAEVNFDPKLGFTVKAKNESWKQFPLHQVCVEVKNKNVGGGEDNLLSLSYGRIIRRSIESAEGLLPESFDGYNIIEQGDIVLRLTDLQNDQTSLRVGIGTEKGIITSAYTTLRPIGVLPEFLGYQLKAFDAAKFFYALGGGLRQSMKYDDLKNFRVMVPSLPEQEVIVADLDERTTKILQLIQDFRTMKTLVQEELSSLITAAVTGQLDVTTGRSVA